jgi:hypothetical protein
MNRVSAGSMRARATVVAVIEGPTRARSTVVEVRPCPR